MSNERTSERTDWKARLESPGALPAQGLPDREAAWEKLYGRLREHPPRRRIAWYWIAAACFPLLLGLLFLLMGRQPRGPVQASAASHRAAGEVAKIGSPAGSGEAAPVFRRTRTSPLKPPGLVNGKEGRAKRGFGKAEVGRGGIAKPEIGNRAIASLFPDSVSATVRPFAFGANQGVRLVTKQLRVVHINELRGSPDPGPSMTLNRHFLDIRIGPGGALREYSPGGPTAGEEISLFKINLFKQ
jgi:hypothetical protein